MKPVLIENAELIDPGVSVAKGSLLMAGGKIAGVNPVSVPADVERINAAGRRLTPGLVDVHTHGIGTFMYENPDHMDGGSRFAAEHGATCVFPSIVPMPGKELASQLDALTRAMEKAGGAQMAGLHLEGPFMAVTGAACPTVDGDVGLLDEMIAACRGRMKIMSLSPETKNIIPVIERLVEEKIVAFITHTRGTAEQAQAAIEAGARHATHFYDVFYSPPEYEPGVRPMGVVEAFMADSRTTVDFICDGCHVPPLVVQAWTAALGWKRIILITDSNIGAGMPAGVYDTPWGYKVKVKPGDGARVAEGPKAGVLAGSALTMDAGMQNMLAWQARLPAEQAWAMGSLNPARLMGLPGKGRLQAGADADLVLWSKETRPVRTWVGGNCVFKSE
jgi:N-acetylglucosamine-6-phosphate deacetylase